MHSATKWFLICLSWLTLNDSNLSAALKDVHMTLPRAVLSGADVVLTCSYDLEQESLYSVNWYKGRREFYRFMPGERPPALFFSNGVKVDMSKSNATSLLLTDVQPSNSGRYSCEVSSDAPFFTTVYASASLEVVELPKTGPQITAPDRLFSIGDILEANCSIDAHRTLVKLAWKINGIPAHPQQSYQMNDFEDERTTTLFLMLVLQPKHFRNRNLTLTCVATIYDLYEQAAEQAIALDATSNQILADGFHAFPDSSGEQGSTVDDAGNIRMHHMKGGDASSSARPASFVGQSPALTLLCLLLLLPSLIRWTSSAAGRNRALHGDWNRRRTLQVGAMGTQERL